MFFGLSLASAFGSASGRNGVCRMPFFHPGPSQLEWHSSLAVWFCGGIRSSTWDASSRSMLRLPPIINSSTPGRTGLFVTRPIPAHYWLSLGSRWSCAIGHSVLMISLPIAFAFLYRINVEERALIQALGESYRAYMRANEAPDPLRLLRPAFVGRRQPSLIGKIGSSWRAGAYLILIRSWRLSFSLSLAMMQKWLPFLNNRASP